MRKRKRTVVKVLNKLGHTNVNFIQMLKYKIYYPIKKRPEINLKKIYI